MRAGVLLSGKMSFSALHTAEVLNAASRAGCELDYLLDAAGDGDGHIRFDGEAVRRHLGKSRLYQALRLVRRFALKNPSTDIKFRDFISDDVFSHSSLATALMGYAGVLAASSLPWAGAVCRGIEETLYRSQIFRDTLMSRNYQAALLSSVGNFGFEAEALFARECMKAGIKTVSVVTNYDNFLNRGSAGFIPDRLGVWSAYMAENALLAGVPANRIEVIGAPSLDPLFAPPPMSRDDYLRGIGLDPGKKTILYAGGVLLGQTFDIIELLVRSGLVGECNLIYRPYPHGKVFSSKTAGLIRNYLESLEDVFVTDAESLSNTIDATLTGFRLAQNARPDEKALQLRHSDVVINHFSTFGLEACVLDVPVVQIAYEGYSMFAIKKGNHPAINCRQVHNSVQMVSGAAEIAYSEDDIVRYVRQYLSDPSRNREERKRYAEFECGVLDGKSTDRMFKLLTQSQS